jgi:hypothetical protein
MIYAGKSVLPKLRARAQGRAVAKNGGRAHRLTPNPKTDAVRVLAMVFGTGAHCIT